MSSQDKLTAGSFFSGIGGFDLAAKWAEIEVIYQVEFNAFCQRVLRKQFPNTTLYGDINEIRPGQLPATDIIFGGPPCQSVSIAGKRLGKEDDRYLWDPYIKLIKELEPTWVISENVVGLVSMGLKNIISEMESIGYEVQAFDLPAGAMGAQHQRRRIWILAHSKCLGWEKRTVIKGKYGIGEAPDKLSDAHKVETLHEQTQEVCVEGISSDTNGSRELQQEGIKQEFWERSGNCDQPTQAEILSYASSFRRIEEQVFKGPTKKGEREWESWATDCFNRSFWYSYSETGRVFDGLPNGLDECLATREERITALGNAVVPQIPYVFLCFIKYIESIKKERTCAMITQI